jgi:peptidyl-prolyl cis-trans isomerase C
MVRRARCGKRLLVFPALLIAWGLLLGTGRPAPADPGEAAPLGVVNADTLSIADLDAELAGMASGPASADTPIPEPDAVLKRLIQNRLFEQEGYRIGFDSLPQVQNQVANLVRNRSRAALLDSITALLPAPDSSDVDSLLSGTSRMNRVSHILVEDEALARALLDSLHAGTSFADLAGRHSRDSVSAVRGGDLGWAREGMFVPEFEGVVQGLEAGETGGPVRTSHGWHVVRLEETREESYGRSDKMREAVVEAIRENRMSSALGAYVSALKVKYQVVVDDSLLRSLDYASSDPVVQERLRTSDSILLESRAGRLSVRGLTRSILFRYFHGLAGRADAPAIRDRIFEDWVAEALLTHEAKTLGFDRKPEVVRQADRLERQLVREEVLKMILDFPFEPEEEALERYYRANETRFLAPRRIKIHSVVLEGEEAARAFRARLDEGAGLKWLASRSEGVIETDPVTMTGWLEVGDVGVDPDSVEIGRILGPVSGPGGWLVAEISAAEKAKPIPLAECRDRVLREMRADRSREVVAGAISKLEGAASVEIRADAKERVAKRLEEWAADRPAAAEPSMRGADE